MPGPMQSNAWGHSAVVEKVPIPSPREGTDPSPESDHPEWAGLDGGVQGAGGD